MKDPFTLQPEHIFYLFAGGIFIIVLSVWILAINSSDWTYESSSSGQCYELFQGDIVKPVDSVNC